MSLFEDIKRDREGGTPGPWEFRKIDGDWSGAHEVVQVGADFGAVCCNTAYYPTGVSDENMKRIARVPDMEAALLAAERLADAVDWMNERGSQQDVANMERALAAYREATS